MTGTGAKKRLPLVNRSKVREKGVEVERRRELSPRSTVADLLTSKALGRNMVGRGLAMGKRRATIWPDAGMMYLRAGNGCHEKCCRSIAQVAMDKALQCLKFCGHVRSSEW